MKFIFLKSQSGFSVVQGLMLASAVAAMALVGTKLTTDQKLAQKSNESQSRLEQLHTLIYSTLQNRDHCTETYNANICYESIAQAQEECEGSSANVVKVIPASDPNNECGENGPFVSHRYCYKATGASQCDSWVVCDGTNIPNPIMSGTRTLNKIMNRGTPDPLFKINTGAGTSNYDASLIYMNNSVSINKMELKYLPSGTGVLEITYGKLASTDMGSRTGKGFGGTTIKKSITLKIQKNANMDFESCYAVVANENENMVKDFCVNLGADNNPMTPNLFAWDNNLQKCVLQNVSCPTGEYFRGFDSNGVKQCHVIKDSLDLSLLFDTTTQNDCYLQTSSIVRFVIVGNKVQIQCNGTPTTPPPPSSCVGSWGACISNTETYTVTSPGTPACPFANGATRSCGAPAGACVGSWGPCSANNQTYTITTPGSSPNCPYANGAQKECGLKCRLEVMLFDKWPNRTSYTQSIIWGKSCDNNSNICNSDNLNCDDHAGSWYCLKQSDGTIAMDQSGLYIDWMTGNLMGGQTMKIIEMDDCMPAPP